MPTLEINQSLSVSGVQSRSLKVTVETQNIVQSVPTVPVAQTGALTTRTDNDTGTLTMSGGHGVVTGKVDVFWDTGSRVGMDATVTSNSIAIDGGTGDNLPTLVSGTYVIQVMNPHVEDIVFVGNNIDGLAVYTDRRGYIVFAQADGTVLFTVKAGTGGTTYFWYDDAATDNPSLVTNPLAGDTVGKIFFSHDDTTATHAPEVSALYN